MAQREQQADERESLADERDRAADEREQLADERDRLADALDVLTLDRHWASRQLPDTSGGVRGSQLRLLESERGLESARTALERSRALVSRQRLAITHESNDGRRQQLAVAREMFASRVTAARRDPSRGLPTP
jgi:hypothetical protein